MPSLFRAALLMGILSLGCSKKPAPTSDEEIAKQYLAAGAKVQTVDPKAIKTSTADSPQIATDAKDDTGKPLMAFEFQLFPTGEFPDLSQPYGIIISDLNVKPAQLKQLQNLSNLQYLELKYEWFDKSAIIPIIAGIKNLRTLIFRNLDNRDIVLLFTHGVLHKLPNAKAKDGGRPLTPNDVVEFSLKDIAVSDETLACLKSFPNLKRLNDPPINMHTQDELSRLSREKYLDAESYAKHGLLHLLVYAKNAKGERPESPKDVVEFSLKNFPITEASIAGLKLFVNLARLPDQPEILTQLSVKAFAKNDLLYLMSNAKTSKGTPPKNNDEIEIFEISDKTTAVYRREMYSSLGQLKNLNTLRYISTEKVPGGPPVNIDELELKDIHASKLLHCLVQATTADGKRPKNAKEVTRFTLIDRGIGINGFMDSRRLTEFVKMLDQFPNLDTVDVHYRAELAGAFHAAKKLYVLPLFETADGKRPKSYDDVGRIVMGYLHLRSLYYPYFGDFKNVKEVILKSALETGEMEAIKNAGLYGKFRVSK